MPGFDWSAGIGGPTIGGWVTVVFYFAAALNCWLVLRRLREVSGRQDSREARAWAAIALLFILLGISKELDLQAALTEFGRMTAVTEGWYRQRRPVQAAFVVFIIMACAILIFVLLKWARRAHTATSLALAGATFVLAFVLIRAVSFHDIDRVIFTRFLLARWNWIIEMGGIAIVLIASEWRKRADNRLGTSRPRSSI
ncbi:MAG: hypothetical protein ACXWJW_02990 [Xanthobacteraceae bacterium]